MSSKKFAKLTIGYNSYAVPVKDAGKLLELLDALEPIDQLRYELEEMLDSTISAKWVRRGKLETITVELIDEPLSPFDQHERLNALREKKYGEEISPLKISGNGVNGKYALQREDGSVIAESYNYAELLQRAREEKAA